MKGALRIHTLATVLCLVRLRINMQVQLNKRLLTSGKVGKGVLPNIWQIFNRTTNEFYSVCWEKSQFVYKNCECRTPPTI